MSAAIGRITLESIEEKRRTLTPDDITEAMRRPSNFGGGPDAARWALGPVIETRDSSAVEKSNAAALVSTLERLYPDDKGETWDVTHASHWAVGWADHLSFVPADETGAPSAILAFMHLWNDALSDYPIADEDDASRREYDDAIEYLGSEYGWKVRDDAPEGWAHDLCRALDESSGDSVASLVACGSSPDDDKCREILADLGYLETDDE